MPSATTSPTVGRVVTDEARASHCEALAPLPLGRIVVDGSAPLTQTARGAGPRDDPAIELDESSSRAYSRCVPPRPAVVQ